MIIKSDYSYGLYEVQHETFLNKSDALFYASNTNKNVRWNFHDSTFGSIDWTKPPSATIEELYHERAKMIRDTYDYVVVHFSGGADSWTVLNSFLSNGLHVDEIYTRWAMTEEKYKQVNNVDKNEINLQSEYHYAVKPVLDEIAKKYPRTKIYVDDYSECYERDISEADLKNGGHYLSMGTFYRFSRKSPWEVEAAKKNKKIGVVYGFDKLQCCVENNQFFSFFVDRIGGTDLDPERSAEFFYWTPKMPQIPVLQSHILKDYYEKNIELHMKEIKIPNNHYVGRNVYISLLYPQYNTRTFQVGKQLGSLIWESEMWVGEHNPLYRNSWKWATNQYLKNIDLRFCEQYKDTNLKLGYKKIYSDKYFIGNFGHNITQLLIH